MSDIEFEAWPKIHRLRREITITEKIDGTNACIIITEDGRIAAQSRKRLITREDDNFGFARFVHENADNLIETLGEGRHFGEWYGLGIQRAYGLDHKRFALFNVPRWQDVELPPFVDTVPVLYQGTFSDGAIDSSLADLAIDGSRLAPGFKPAEGVVVFLTASHQSYKVLLDNDEIPKSIAA